MLDVGDDGIRNTKYVSLKLSTACNAFNIFTEFILRFDFVLMSANGFDEDGVAASNVHHVGAPRRVLHGNDKGSVKGVSWRRPS